MFSVARIRDRLNIQLIEVHEELESTNDRALELTRLDDPTTPALIVASRQTAGRGQRGRAWFSNEGSLTFSWIAPRLDPANLEKQSLNLVPLAAALAVIDAVESRSSLDRIQIKWPNDLIVKNRKLGGILVESSRRSNAQFTIIGIGINANNANLSLRQTREPGPQRTASLSPTSIFMETQQTTELDELLLGIVERLDAEFKLATTQPSSVVNRCQSRLSMVGKQVRISTPNGTEMTGIGHGISQDGGIQVESDGVLQTFYSGTLSSVDGSEID